MWAALVARWMLVLGGGWALLTLFMVVVDALGGMGQATGTTVGVEAMLLGPDGTSLGIEYRDDPGGRAVLGAVVERDVTLADAGWPRWASFGVAMLRQALLAGGLLWTANAFDQIRAGRALTSSVGRTLRRSGLVLLLGELVRTAMVVVVTSDVDRVLHAGPRALPPEVTAVPTGETTVVGVAGLLALVLVVFGLVVEQAAPIVEEHELTV